MTVCFRPGGCIGGVDICVKSLRILYTSGRFIGPRQQQQIIHVDVIFSIHLPRRFKIPDCTIDIARIQLFLADFPQDEG